MNGFHCGAAERTRWLWLSLSGGAVLLAATAHQPARGQQLPFQGPPSRQEVRRWVNNLPAEGRKEAIRAFYEQYGAKMAEGLARQRHYQLPAEVDDDTHGFLFKRTPQRELNVFVDYPGDWKRTDRRPAIVFWHGGGFTQGNAGQFFAQANYFAARGAVCFRPEYRIRDLDGTMPHAAIEDGISAMRWIKKNADRFGIDPERIAAGGGSAGGCMAAVMGTVDAEKMAAAGFVGRDDDRAISPRPAAMILYNPFVDFFEPLNIRHLEEEALMSGEDPEDYRELYHAISAIENLNEDSPPSIILFGTRDAFYPQQIRWIVKCRELGLTVRDYVYKNEVHSWYNNSPHLEYTTENVDKFLVEIGLLEAEPKVEPPHKPISPGRAGIQKEKYDRKTDWDEQQRFRRYAEEHQINVIPFKHDEEER